MLKWYEVVGKERETWVQLPPLDLDSVPMLNIGQRHVAVPVSLKPASQPHNSEQHQPDGHSCTQKWPQKKHLSW